MNLEHELFFFLTKESLLFTRAALCRCSLFVSCDSWKQPQKQSKRDHLYYWHEDLQAPNSFFPISGFTYNKLASPYAIIATPSYRSRYSGSRSNVWSGSGGCIGSATVLFPVMVLAVTTTSTNLSLLEKVEHPKSIELLKSSINIKLCCAYFSYYYFYRVQRKEYVLPSSSYTLRSIGTLIANTPAINQEWLLTLLKSIWVSFIL